MKQFLLTATAILITGLGAMSQTVFLDEDFENGIPASWSQATLASDGGWIAGSPAALSSGAWPVPVHDGDLVATNDDACNCDKSADSLFTDTIDLATASGLLLLKLDVVYGGFSYQGAVENFSVSIWSESNQTWTDEYNPPTLIPLSWRANEIIDISAYIGDEIVVAFVYDDGSGWTYGAGIDNVSIYEANSYDVANMSVDNEEYQEENISTDIVGTVMNFGSETVTSLTLSYSVDGGSAVTGTISGLSIAPLTMYNYTHPTAWTPTKQQSTNEETQNVEVTITMVNGNNDADMSNNVANTDVIVHIPAVTRKPLLEQFTSSTCPPCVPGNINVLNILSNYPGTYSKINYQMSWPGNGDPYYTLEGGERRGYYAVNSVPMMFTDGGVALNSNSYSASYFESAMNAPAYLNLLIEGTLQLEEVYEVQDGALVKVDSMYNLTAQVDGEPIIDMPSGLIGHISLQEDLTYNNVETNGETEFHDVMKKMLPDELGNSLPAVLANDSFSFSEMHSFPLVYRLPNDANDPVDHTIEHSIEEWDDLRLVAWVQDNSTGHVWQSENAEVEMLDPIDNLKMDTVDGQVVYVVDGESWVMFGDELAPLGVNATVADLISVYPNPTQGTLNIAGVRGVTTVRILDAAGRVVMNTSIENGSLDVSRLEAGIYNVSIENNGVTKVEKVTIVH